MHKTLVLRGSDEIDYRFLQSRRLMGSDACLMIVDISCFTSHPFFSSEPAWMRKA
jgi:hypothetical protein